MNTNAPCRSKQPAFCAYHGVPQGNLAYDAVKTKLDDVLKEQKKALKKMDIEAATKLEDQVNSLESRLYLLASYAINKKTYTPKKLPKDTAARNAYEENERRKYRAELKEYKIQLGIRLTGEDTPFVRSISGGDYMPTTLVNRGIKKGYKEFTYGNNPALIEPMKAKADAYAKRHGFDGIVDGDHYSGEVGFYIPYNLQAGEMHPAEYHAKANQPEYRKIADDIRHAARVLGVGKKRQIAALAK